MSKQTNTNTLMGTISNGEWHPYNVKNGLPLLATQYVGRLPARQLAIKRSISTAQEVNLGNVDV